MDINVSMNHKHQDIFDSIYLIIIILQTHNPAVSIFTGNCLVKLDCHCNSM